MKILLAIALAIVLGLAIGVGAGWWRYDSRPYGGPSGLPRDGLPEVDAGAAAQPKAVVDNARHEFGRMFIGEDGKHDFVLRNDGNAPLEIREGKKTCRCTDVIIEKSSIQPGRSGKVTVSWRSDQQVDASREIAHATIRTTDPDQRSIKLTVLGRIIPAARTVPGELVFDRLSAGEPTTAVARLYGYVKRSLKILAVDVADKRTAEYFDAAVEPLSKMLKHTDADVAAVGRGNRGRTGRQKRLPPPDNGQTGVATGGLSAENPHSDQPREGPASRGPRGRLRRGRYQDRGRRRRMERLHRHADPGNGQKW